jgi:PAS domain S-box-containing protein
MASPPPPEDRHAIEQLLAVFEHAPSGVALIDRGGRFLRVNPALVRIAGRSEQELLARRWQELIHPDDLARAEAEVAAAMAGGARLEDVFRTRRPDGVEREVRVVARAIGGSPGNSAAFVVHYEDVTERRVQERSFRSLDTRLRALVRAAPDAIIIREGDGRVALWNPAAEAMFGRSAAEVLGGRNEGLVVVADDLERLGEIYARVRAGETLTARLRGRRADGTTFPARMSAAPLRDEGVTRGSVTIVRDITDVVEAEQKLAMRALELARTNKDLESFAFAASHDLQEPLRAITLATEAVVRSAGDRLDHDERELLRYVDESASGTSARVAALLRLARGGPGAVPDDGSAVERAVADALTGLRVAIEEAQAAIVVRRPLPALPLPRDELALILQNLIANAIKYHRPGEHPQVTVSGCETERYAELEVADQGVGLAEAERARIFEAFHQGRAGREGVGLGLAVVRRIAERRHASVWVDSEGPGCGARFRLRVPR